jgi:hypothetical protein
VERKVEESPDLLADSTEMLNLYVVKVELIDQVLIDAFSRHKASRRMRHTMMVNAEMIDPMAEDENQKS